VDAIADHDDFDGSESFAAVTTDLLHHAEVHERFAAANEINSQRLGVRIVRLVLCPVDGVFRRCERKGCLLFSASGRRGYRDMSVRAAHDIAVAVEESIKTSLPDIYDVIVHIEPSGNIEDERFGLTAADTSPDP